MATPQLSPGVLIREVDLTVGRAENVLDNIGAIVGPFEKGPVNEVIDITTEQELLNVFGKPISTDGQYEYWMSASSYLSYGGILKVVRTTGSDLVNANAGFNGAADNTLKIENYEDYETNHSADSVDFAYAAKNPGTWANNLKVCVIDDKADQTIGIVTTDPGSLGAVIGYGVTAALTSVSIANNDGTVTSNFNGYIKGIITGVTTSADGSSSIDVKVLARVSDSDVVTQISYAENSVANSFTSASELTFVNNSGISTGSATAGTVLDWYDQQTLELDNSIIFWKSIAPKPVATQYSLDRNGGNDALHVVIIDDTGSVTGVGGNLLEKHLFLSKAADATSAVNPTQKNFWKNFIALNSQYVYAGANPSDQVDTVNGTIPTPVGFTSISGWTKPDLSDGLWNLNAQGVTFNSIGNVTYSLAEGSNYSNVGGMTATLADVISGYSLFSNKDEVAVDYLIMGPSASDEASSQAKANHLISIAGLRKDCIAVISPHRTGVVGQTNTTTQTNNIIKFFSSLQSSSYAVFDSGYKYTFDRFNNQFRYIPCNPDIAGLMVRTSIEAFPWFSPAGQQRGILNNAVKLAYNPNKAQRDQLYAQRVNAIVNQPGTGILLFGDRTGLGYASAFDRINVRRLFLTIEQALEDAAQAQLFELNDEITRANFVNIVEPYLRDVQAKRGLYDFLVVCDETNNTPDVIDNNEFRANIFLKPAKSINYVTLTFVATRTGVSFEEVAGRV